MLTLINMNHTDKVLIELQKFMAENDVLIIKSSPVNGKESNNLCISIHDQTWNYVDYQFEEDISSDKILNQDYIKL